MKTHPDNAAVLVKACKVLVNLAVNADNRVAIAAAGGIAVRIAALGHHLSNPSLCLPLVTHNPTSNITPLFH